MGMIAVPLSTAKHVGTGQAEHSGEKVVKELGGKTLETLCGWYKSQLFDRFLVNMDRFVVDHDYGGFMCAVDISSGELLATHKRTWYEGRGLWTYAFLYNRLLKDNRILEVASRSMDFIMKHRPAKDGFWPSSFTREGQVLHSAGDDNPWISEAGDIYGNLFVAEGLAAYACAIGDDRYFETAKQIMLDSMAIYEAPGYRYSIDYLSPNAPSIPGIRVLGHWMVALRAATQMLEYAPDPAIAQIADHCVNAIMQHHLNPAYELLNEALNRDFSVPANEFNQFAYLGHGIETLWMVMAEAIRRRDAALFERARKSFRRHVEVAHDVVYGGYFRSCDHVDNHTWKTDKALWLQEEVLIGTLLLVKCTGDEWAQQCFTQTYRYVCDTFIKPDYKFWVHAGDRKMEHYMANRAEHYHHPRHLMLNLLALEELIENGGKVLDPFQNSGV